MSMSKEKIDAFVAAWYQALDFHVPIEQVYSMLAETGLNVQFPDGDIRDYDSFKVWYDRVTNLFFDENHYVQSVTVIEETDDEVVLDIIVGWQASWWQPPAAKSKRTSMTATQQWKVKASDSNPYGMVIVNYNATVKPFEYAPGFAQL